MSLVDAGRCAPWVAASFMAAASTACSSDAPDPFGESGGGPVTGGSAGASVVGGAAGSTSGAGGNAGSTGGDSGAGAGAGGMGASGGMAAAAGSGGGAAGTSGAAGLGGSAGAAGGNGGSGGSGGSAGSSGCGKAAMTGTFQATVTAFGLERGYYVSVPSTYDSSAPNRLLFGYHGSNYTGEMMRRYLDLERAPLVDGSVFVYPDGLPLEGQPDHIAWELDADGRDIAFFDELLEKLRGEYCIDPERIFVNGQSYGGLMTNFVGCLRGDVVRAIAVVAGSGPRNSAMCQGQVAAWLTHGMDDESVNFESGEASRDHWVEANHCTTATMPGMPEQCLNYQGCDAGHPVIWCPHVDDGGHQHPSFGRAAVREFFASF